MIEKFDIKNQRETFNKIDDRIVEQVKVFKFLGVWLKISMVEELKEQINSAINIYWSLNRSAVRKNNAAKRTKITIYRTIFRPILMGLKAGYSIDRRRTDYKL